MASFVECACCVLGAEFIRCDERSVCVIEYKINNEDDGCELSNKQTFEFADASLGYDSTCGICILDDLSEYKKNDDVQDEFKSETHHDERYHILVFGNGYPKNINRKSNFVSSLQWLSLEIMNKNNNDNNDSISHIFAIDVEKTKHFQNTFVDKTFAVCEYREFGYIKWKDYLILFGGRVSGGKSIDSIFYFDCFEMKWYQSLKVL